LNQGTYVYRAIMLSRLYQPRWLAKGVAVKPKGSWKARLVAPAAAAALLVTGLSWTGHTLKAHSKVHPKKLTQSCHPKLSLAN